MKSLHQPLLAAKLEVREQLEGAYADVVTISMRRRARPVTYLPLLALAFTEFPKRFDSLIAPPSSRL